MWKFLLSINKKLFWAIPVMMSLGFLFGRSVNQETVKSLKALIMPLTFLMVYPMMVTLNIQHLKEGIKNVKLQVVTQAINFGIVPFLAYGLGRYFFPDNNYMALGLLLASLLPTSGMTISWTGFAKGNWFFEASFPIVVVDWDGRIIGNGIATAKDEWMTEKFVPFEGTITFEKPAGAEERLKRGAVIFRRDNPSGLPQNDAALEIPVYFK